MKTALTILSLLMLCSGTIRAEVQRNVVGSVKFPWMAAKSGAEVVLCENGARPASFLLDTDEPYAVQRTLRDVCGDLHDATGLVFPVTNAVPLRSEAEYMIIAGVAGESEPLSVLEAAGKIDLKALRGKKESFLLTTVPEPFRGCKGAIVIAGSDVRGTIYGLYALTQDGLGVDPLRFWTENPVVRRKSLFLGKLNHIEAGPRFPYRGWFINDEDFLLAWHGPGGNAPELYEHILSTALRLRQNMIIPATAFNPAKPNDRRMLKMVKDYGLLLTTHHAMPLGVWGTDWTMYWKAKGEEVEFSYVKNRDKFEEIWRHGADSYAPYMGIWQVGLRGKIDNPIWTDDTHFPTDQQERSKLIEDAMGMQMRILREKTGSADVPVTTTLWAEVLGLYTAGHLKIPDDVICIISDLGRGNMDHLEKIGLKGPFPDNRAGVYYHVAFQNGHDSHLVETVHPQRIADAFKLIEKYNLTTYCLVNVSNIREFLMSTRALADVSWTGKLDPDEFYLRWCREQFGEEAAADIVEAYKQQAALPHRTDEQEDSHFAVQGLVVYGFEMLDTARNWDASADWAKNWGLFWHKNLSFRSALEYYSLHCGEDAQKWDRLWDRMVRIEKTIPRSRRQFYRDNVLLQCHTARQCTKWLRDVSRCCLHYLNGDMKAASSTLASARASLESVRQAQKQAEHGKWAGYYSNHFVVAFARAERVAEGFGKALEYGGVATRRRLTPIDGVAAEPELVGGYGHMYTRVVKPEPVTSASLSRRYMIEDPAVIPDLISLEFSKVPNGPVKVVVNGREIGSVSGERMKYIRIPADLTTGADMTVNLEFGPNAQVSQMMDFSVYGRPAVGVR